MAFERVKRMAQGKTPNAKTKMEGARHGMTPVRFTGLFNGSAPKRINLYQRTNSKRVI
jgi:hypothetical protein